MTGRAKQIRWSAAALLAVLLLFWFPSAAKAATASEKQVYTYFTEEMDLPPAAACGIMGMIKPEASFIPDIYSPDGYYGICQWSSYRVNGSMGLRQFCVKKNLNSASLNGQLAFISYELKNVFPNVYSYLVNVENTESGAQKAGYKWMAEYEGAPAAARQSQRISGISHYWSEFGSSSLYLSASAVKGGVKLTWTGQAAGGFSIERQTSGEGPYIQIQKTASSVHTFTDRTVKSGKSYSYLIRGLNAKGVPAGSSNAVNALLHPSLTDPDCEILLSSNVFTYSGKKIYPKITVRYDGSVLKKNKDYKLSFKNNLNAGKATVTVTGTGNYKGKVKLTFRINKKAQKITSSTSIRVTAASSRIKVKASAKGKITLKSSNKDIAAVSGRYLKLKKAGIIQLTIRAAATKNYLAASKTITVTILPGKPSVKKAKRTSPGSIVFSAKAAGKPAGYEVKYSTSSKMKENLQVITTSNGTCTLKNLQPGKKYYIRVRAYKMSGDHRIYSSWSKVCRVSGK